MGHEIPPRKLCVQSGTKTDKVECGHKATPDEKSPPVQRPRLPILNVRENLVTEIQGESLAVHGEDESDNV